MKIRRTVAFLGAVALTMSATVSLAAVGDVYQSSYQGVTFTFNQTDADTLTLRLNGTLSGDWAGANYLGAFSTKNLGLDFGSVTGIANGPGAVNLSGVQAELSNANNVGVVCGGGGNEGICFNLVDVLLNPMPFDLLYTIDFSAPLSIGSPGPHLKLAFLANAGDLVKVGSLYSQDVPLSSSSTSSTSSTSNGSVPEPASSTLALLGVGLLAGALRQRRKARSA